MRKNGIIIAIDGPTASGKSTTAKQVAARLGYVHLNTGAMYRAFALLVRRRDHQGHDLERVHELLAEAEIGFNNQGNILLNGANVSREILEPDIALLASELSTDPAVRAKLVEKQRSIGRDGGVVLEGRDIGTVVFPDAELKIFLIADARVRAERRQLEFEKMGTHIPLEELRQQLEERDKRDRERAISPLLKAPDAVEVDTTSLTIEGQVERVYELSKEKM
ncbi:MAG TPA: (d)CMP kinase [Candidatus Kapabacteria bacterium]|jgi:cytidylate kinase|nr:(d)CMP kinase [Candidatus Kapabacteria bacterium]